MKGSFFIKFFLTGFLLILCSQGFSQDLQDSQDSVQVSVVQENVEPLPPPPPPISREQSFRLPGQKNPRKATWLSVCLPGAGQIYNKQWYKVPFIYAGFGALIYMYNWNKSELNLYQTEYRGRLSGDTNFIPNPDLIPYSNDNVRSARDYYQRNIELSYILSGLLYILNIVDACVFAHLSTFDVSDNLSMRVQPFASPDLSAYALTNQQLPMQGGIKFTFTLK